MTGQEAFVLHERLRRDTVDLGRLLLSRALLMNDSSFPWVILVPEREAAELCDLSAGDRAAVMEEISAVSSALRRLYSPDKLNVGVLGNIVQQLHIHVVARFRSDRAWPGPVWGSPGAVPYKAEELEGVAARLRSALVGALPPS